MKAKRDRCLKNRQQWYNKTMKRYVIAITGASGPTLGVRVIREVAKQHETHIIMSRGALEIMHEETGTDWRAETPEGVLNKIKQDIDGPDIHYWDNKEMGASVASGSFRTDGMAVVPCSMKTLAGIAAGYAENLIQRAADVTIKEGRPLTLCPREMPLRPIHRENMLKLSRIGVRIAPPIPACYFGPKTLDDMVDFMAGKVLDTLDIPHNLYKPWEGRQS